MPQRGSHFGAEWIYLRRGSRLMPYVSFLKQTSLPSIRQYITHGNNKQTAFPWPSLVSSNVLLFHAKQGLILFQNRALKRPTQNKPHQQSQGIRTAT